MPKSIYVEVGVHFQEKRDTRWKRRHVLLLTLCLPGLPRGEIRSRALPQTCAVRLAILSVLLLSGPKPARRRSARAGPFSRKTNGKCWKLWPSGISYFFGGWNPAASVR